MMVYLNNPAANGDMERRDTLAPPAELPNMVTLSESPPNLKERVVLKAHFIVLNTIVKAHLRGI